MGVIVFEFSFQLGYRWSLAYLWRMDRPWKQNSNAFNLSMIRLLQFSRCMSVSQVFPSKDLCHPLKSTAQREVEGDNNQTYFHIFPNSSVSR